MVLFMRSQGTLEAPADAVRARVAHWSCDADPIARMVNDDDPTLPVFYNDAP